MTIVVNSSIDILHPIGKDVVTPPTKNIVNLSSHVERRLTMERRGYERVKERFIEHHMIERLALVPLCRV